MNKQVLSNYTKLEKQDAVRMSFKAKLIWSRWPNGGMLAMIKLRNWTIFSLKWVFQRMACWSNVNMEHIKDIQYQHRIWPPNPSVHQQRWSKHEWVEAATKKLETFIKGCFKTMASIPPTKNDQINFALVCDWILITMNDWSDSNDAARFLKELVSTC